MELDFNQILFFLTSITLIAAAIYLVKTASRTHREPSSNNTVLYSGMARTPVAQAIATIPQQNPRNPQNPVAIAQPSHNYPTAIVGEPQICGARTIKLEVELPRLPERIRIPFEKLPRLLELLESREEKPIEAIESPREESVEHHRSVVQEDKVEEKGETTSFMEHPEAPWLDIISRVSGLEFSRDGRRVYCTIHGWVPYIVTVDGRIMCREGYHTLWDPNRERYKPPSKQELLELKRMLDKLKDEVGELQRVAEMTPTLVAPPRKKGEKGIMEEGEELEELEEREEYEEEELREDHGE